MLRTIVMLAMVLAIASSITATFSTSSYATTGMGNCKDRDDCTRQPDRVGADNDDPDNAGEDADRDGPGGSDTDPNDDDTGDANCWGQVTKALADNDDGQPGIGEHTSDPRPGDDDNETPREGIGNQKEGHPSDHADTVGGLADEVPDCVD